MNLSTSSFERRALVAFLVTFTVIAGAFEVVVRRSESLFGVRPQRTVISPHLAHPKVHALIDEVSAHRYDMVIVGSSRAEYGIHPDLLDGGAGAAYNGAIGGVSPMSGLEMLSVTGVRPQVALLAVSPMDFTDTAVRRSQKAVVYARERVNQLQPDAETFSLARQLESAFRALFHSSTSERKRHAGQWKAFAQSDASLLEFLNNADLVNLRKGHEVIRGFIGENERASQAQLSGALRWSIPSEYMQQKTKHLLELERRIEELTATGSTVVILRMPPGSAARRAEDATSFDEDIRAIARNTGCPYIDGLELVPGGFTEDTNHYIDEGHMSIRGASVFTPLLRAALGRSMKTP